MRETIRKSTKSVGKQANEKGRHSLLIVPCFCSSSSLAF